MSGIAGIIRFDGGPVERGLVETMTAAMPYRGPDGINHWVRGSVALGQCMLRTTPESLEETQPLTNEDESLVLVMDGRVDNWEELRRELLARGAALRTRADAELVLRAYEIWGWDCLTHIDGDFALVIWDARQQEAFCARDRFGNKPFTYHWDGRILVFASELHAILAMPWVPQIPNEGMIVEYLADEWFSFDETIWTGVMRLPSAHWMSVGPAGPQPTSYWMPDLNAPQPYTKDEDYFTHYRHLFADSVRRQSRSHKPVAYEVSGGLDSSAVFCVAEHLRRVGTLPAPSINGYTIAWTQYDEANELLYARSVGEYLGVPIQEIEPCIKGIEWLQDQARLYRDFPGYSGTAHHNNLYCKSNGALSRVIVTGLGGDQFVAGSRAHYAEEITRPPWTNLLRCLREDIGPYGLIPTLWLILRHGLLPHAPKVAKIAYRPLARRLDARTQRGTYWLTPAMKNRLLERRAQLLRYRGLRIRRRGQLRLLQSLYDPFNASNREAQERVAAFWGLETRHPFYHSEFVQFAFVTPERLRSRGAQNKYIHVNALTDLIPSKVRERLCKAELSAAAAQFIMQFEKEITIEIPQARPAWLDQRGIRKLFQSYAAAPDRGWQQWPLMGILSCDVAIPQKKW
jgi:asparagine synthase (glutamine-hydrolysing)